MDRFLVWILLWLRYALGTILRVILWLNFSRSKVGTWINLINVCLSQLWRKLSRSLFAFLRKIKWYGPYLQMDYFQYLQLGKLSSGKRTISVRSKSIWCSLLPLKIFFIGWRLISNFIPLNYNLQKRGFQLASRCVCCKEEQESIDHFFIDGRVAKEVWQFFLKHQGWYGIIFHVYHHL